MTNRKLPHDALPLRTVSRLTGLTPDVIRAWEKRYAVVKPRRGPRGARLYGSADIARLCLLHAVVRTGRAIGDVAHLDAIELTPLAGVHGVDRARAHDDSPDTVQRALAALEQFDAVALNQSLSDSLIALGARQFCRRVAAPLLAEVGRRWADGRLSIADEHLVSGALRNMLGAIARNRGDASGSVVLLAAPTGERHELGLLLAALTTAEAGVAPYYLGADLPAQEIISAARRARAAAVGLAIVNGENERRALEEVRRIERGLAAETELWLGGAQAAALAVQLKGSRAIVLDDVRALDSELERVRASSPRVVGGRTPEED